MKIEIAVPNSASTKDKGDLLESIAGKLLSAQSYEVVKEIRLTAVELDLLCQHKINGKEIYVECKAYRNKNIDANILKNLAGTRMLKDYSEAWLISTSQYGKEAKGFVNEWQKKPKELSTTLSFYTPEKVIDSLISTGIVENPPVDTAADYMGSKNLIGEWVLLITQYGNFWAVATLSGGIPSGVICYYANNNELVKDETLIENIAATDTSLNSLEFKVPTDLCPKSVSTEIIDVVEVQTGEEWSDYRPARPQDFVGRSKDIKYIFDFFKKIQNGETNTRAFALTGDSGMGKSSLIAKLADKARNKQNKNNYFVYPVDVRAAISPSYIYSAILNCFNKAQKVGFGDSNITLSLSDVSNPLNSDSIKEYLCGITLDNKLIVLIFDQFEELYSKPELYEVFKRAESLLINATAIKANFCIGFAWKSDSTTHNEHPAYFFWHKLSDYRITRKLSPFSDGESKAAINIFEKEISQKLHNDLKHNLLSSCQGYPWLLKKLCIHIYEKIKEGVEQKDLVDNKLDVAVLFDSDLQQLSIPEKTCLNFIAERAPVDWFEVINLSGADTLNSLIHRRLVIRSGDRLNIYWDIFREYILTEKVPVIPLRYLPSNDFNSVYKVAKHLKHDVGLSVQDLVELSGLSEGTIQNIGSVIYMFGIATRESGAYLLNKELSKGEELDFLRAIREKFKKHAFTLSINDRTSNSMLSLNEAISILKSVYPNNTYAETTWHSYTIRLCRWLEQCGFLVALNKGWVYRDKGDVVTGRDKPSHNKNRGKLFTAPTSHGLVLEALKWIVDLKQLAKNEKRPKGYRNALLVLNRFKLTTQDSKFIYPNIQKIEKYSSLKESIWVAANSEPVLVEIMKLLETKNKLSGKEIGKYLSDKYSLYWSDASVIRTGGAIRLWAMWLYEGKRSSTIQ